MTTKQQRHSALQRQIQHLDTRLAMLNTFSTRYSSVRLVIIAVGLLLALAALSQSTQRNAIIVLFGTMTLFAVVVVRHRRMRHSIARHETYRQLKQTHLARMQLDWYTLPVTTPPVETHHPFVADLDLADLHRLVNTATSHGGSLRLWQWLTAQRPEADAILKRQSIVQELIPLTTFRDKLTMRTTLGGDNLFEQDHAAAINRWLRSSSTPGSLTILLSMMTSLAALNIFLLILFIASDFPGLWGITFATYAALYLSKLQTVQELHGTALFLDGLLRRLKAVTQQVETYHFGQRKHLRKLCLPLIEAGPSGIVRRMSLIVAAAGLRGHPLVWALVNAALPWDLLFAHRLNQHKAMLADKLPQWLDVWFELEALSSLSTFAALNPHYTMPHVIADNDIVFSATGIGHPLIADDEKVCNNFTFKDIGEIIMITGSNMSGKSSFLRTLGINLVLANAGSVVNADSLHTRPLRLFSVIHISDSLQDGISYFYAEVKRLRMLLDTLQADDDVPLFYIIDEIFRGTNNRERLVGSRSYIRALAEQNGIGLIATHDLELVRLADENPAIKNYHFRETVDDGRMIFDYKLRNGASPTTNALKIMALEGLPLDAEEL